MKRISRLLHIMVLGVISLLVFSVPAYAGTTTGTTVSTTLDGILYRAHCSTTTILNTATGGVYLTAASTRPAGYMGATTYLFNRSGSVVASNTQYSQSSTSHITVMASSGSASGAQYYTSGSAHIYRTGGYYSSFGVPGSPYATAPRNLDNSSGVLDNGMTYGNAYQQLSSGNSADSDLISAVGNSGVEGYVLMDDLLDASLATSPSEATSAFADETTVQIPLYNLNGAVIDTFDVQIGGCPN